MRIYVYQWYLDPGTRANDQLYNHIASFAPPDATHMVEVHYTGTSQQGDYKHRETYDEDHPAFQELMTLVLLGRATLTELNSERGEE